MMTLLEVKRRWFHFTKTSFFLINSRAELFPSSLCSSNDNEYAGPILGHKVEWKQIEVPFSVTNYRYTHEKVPITSR